MIHSKSKIAHMLAGRKLPSIEEPVRESRPATIDAQEDFLYAGKQRMLAFIHSSDALEYHAAWMCEREDLAQAIGRK